MNQKIRVCYDYGTAGYITDVAANTDAVTTIDSTATGAGRHDMMYDAVGNVTYQKDNVSGFEKELTFNSYNRIHTVRDVGRNLIVGTYRYPQALRSRGTAAFVYRRPRIC